MSVKPGKMDEFDGNPKETHNTSTDCLAVRAKIRQKRPSRIEELDAYSRRDNLIITGLPVDSYAEAASTSTGGNGNSNTSSESNECVVRSALKLFNEKLNVSVKPDDISVAHRLRKPQRGTAQATPPATIVRFTSRKVRDLVYNSRRLLRNVEATSRSERIFLNEDLTVSTARLFYAARQMVRSRSLHSAWTFTGTVYVKDSMSSRPRKVTTVDDLSSISA